MGMSWSPRGKSRGACTYQEAPSQTVICNAELLCMLLTNLETMQTLKNRWPSSPSPPSHPPTPPTGLSGELQHCARLHKAGGDNNISVPPSRSQPMLVHLAFPIIDAAGPLAGKVNTFNRQAANCFPRKPPGCLQ